MLKAKVSGIAGVLESLKKTTILTTKAGKERLIETLVKDLAAATPVDTGVARNGWHAEGSTIVNRVPYIDELNAGSSAQAPSHFIEKTLLRNPAVVPNGVIVTYR